MSKGLEALKFIQFADSESKETIEKELKALEIIKKKKVLIDVLLDTDTLKDYNDFKSKKENLTQDEYNLLKEVLL